MKKKEKHEINSVLSELSALLSCDDTYVAFNRVLTRTMPMLRKLHSLDDFWDQVRNHNEYIKWHETENMAALGRLRKEMNLDELIPSLKSRNAGGIIGVLMELNADKGWIEEARRWLLSKADDIEDLDPKENELMTVIMMYDWIHSKSYVIGEDPVQALALFERISDKFLAVRQLEEHPYSPVYRSPPMVELLCRLKRVVAYLIAELPNVKLWRAFSRERLTIKQMACDIAKEEWSNDPSLSRAEVARRVHAKISKQFITTPGAIEKMIKPVDPRTKHERKMAQKKSLLKLAH